MLWLKKSQSLKKISLQEYLDLIKKQGFNILKILQYSHGSCVCLTANNTVIKVLNPSLAKYQFKNLRSANKYFTKQGIKVPNILDFRRLSGFYIIESEYINNKLFINKTTLDKTDKFFFKLFNKLSKKSSSKFGPLSMKESLIPSFKNQNYIGYWDKQFEYFLNKISRHYSLINNIKKCYNASRKKISVPCYFILSHSDISPKHIFAYKSQIGCVDLEEAMYLDASFMWSLWYVRTINKRSNKSIRDFFYKALLQNIDPSWLNFHVCRELFIQYYYQGLLDYFIRDYYKFLKYSNLLHSARKLTK